MGPALNVAKAMRVKGDIQSIKTSLMSYNGMNGFYPTTEQGLNALVSRPGSEPAPTSLETVDGDAAERSLGMPYMYSLSRPEEPGQLRCLFRGP